jgi:CubicO group peptidase (beta-lactamase class C family)
MYLQAILSKILPFLVIGSPPYEPPGAPPPLILNQNIEKFVTQLLEEYKSPAGVGIAAVRKDARGVWRVEAKGYGNAKLDGTKVTEDTIFAIASNSKVRDP